MMNISHIPKEILEISNQLKAAGYEAYLVGGCVRDLLLNRAPKDWDLTTNATPEQIIAGFPNTFYENKFGTVGVVSESTEDPTLKVVEVTPYRIEGDYSDGRHPNEIAFSTKLEDDLKRRDFTINAMALDIDKGHIIDLYNGQEDLKDSLLKAVGDAGTRFKEDGLRIIRAIRLAADLGFTINTETAEAIVAQKAVLEKISKERIRDELVKLLNSDQPMLGLGLAQRLGILGYIIPELEEGLHAKQNQAHAYTVFEHLLRSVQHAADKKYPFEVRLAALLHDVGKPRTSRYSDDKGDVTFYGHEVVGARMTEKILKNLKFPTKTIETVTKLVRWHMFFSDTEQITLSAVRRMVANVGEESIWDLINLRICDRIGTGRPKENPYRFRKYQAMIEQVLRDPVTVGMLKIDGKRLMDVTHVTPGPKIGFILHALLEEVLEDPALNTVEYLEKRSTELSSLSEAELKEKGQEGKRRKEEEEAQLMDEINKKHYVK
ncbi:MAG: hypothetical protein RL094_150 [Candidatus Parcubacteria bacterium]